MKKFCSTWKTGNQEMDSTWFNQGEGGQVKRMKFSSEGQFYFRGV